MPPADLDHQRARAAEEAGHPRRWAILTVLVISLLVVVIDNTILNVALKTLADPVDGLGATQSELAWMINSYTLVFAGLLFAAGVVGDRWGRKRMILAGLAVFGLASLASAYAASPAQLILFRGVMGVGAAMLMPCTLSLLRAVFPPREFPRALAIWTAAVGASGALGPLVGGALLERFWWGSVFLVNVPVVVFGIIAVAVLAPESTGGREKPDIAGMVLSIAGLMTLTYGIIEAGERGTWNDVEAWGTIAVGVLVLAWFVWWEGFSSHASLDVGLFRNREFSVSAVMMALVFFVSMGLMFFMSFYLQLVRDYSPMRAGLLFLPTAIAMLLFAPGSNALVKRFGPRAVSLAGMVLLAASIGVVATLGQDTSIWVVVAAFALQGVAMANLMPPAMTTLMAAMPAEKAGVASAFGNTLRQVGGSLGVAVFSTVMAQVYRDSLTDEIPLIRGEARESVATTYAAVEKVDINELTRMYVLDAANRSFIDAMQATAFAALGVCLLGFVAVFFYPRKRREAEPKVPAPRDTEPPEWGPPLPPLPRRRRASDGAPSRSEGVRPGMEGVPSRSDGVRPGMEGVPSQPEAGRPAADQAPPPTELGRPASNQAPPQTETGRHARR
ncbi:MFS transporter [Salininema proteolyticum]|uniref:MFS transporter n=1 Tax=Salininema proteolyticum TaxID=1607685 RepID=A0ABV8TVX8_9ACTN